MREPGAAGRLSFVPDSRLVQSVRASPNHGERLGRVTADAIVLHYTGMADGGSALDWLCHPASSVSCHYVVEEDGQVIQLVPEARRAWHAGLSSWAGERDVNSASIGIEIVNGGHDHGLPPFPERQVAAVAALCRDIVDRRHIRPDRVLAHSDVAPGRKRDPGERFPWGALHEAGVGIWTTAEGDDGPGSSFGHEGRAVTGLQAGLRRYGYGLDVTGRFDAETRTVVAAFQRHFRPERVDGAADPQTLARLDDLLGQVGGPRLTPASAHGRDRA